MLAIALSVAGCTSVLTPPAVPEATGVVRGSCTIVVSRPGGDWSRWDEQVCEGSGPDMRDSSPWLVALVAQAVDDAEIAACGSPRCAARARAVRFYIVPSSASVLASQTDEDRIAVVLSSALAGRVGQDEGFYELAFAHELAHLRLGATCGEGVQSDDALRDLACDREALRWLQGKRPGDAEWARRARVLAEARIR
jgi:hypothetical protein